MEGLNDTRLLMIGDKLSFNVLEDESQPRTVVITDSGEVDVPYINRLVVGKRTCKQLAYHIKQLLEKEYYYKATVIIGLDSAGAGNTRVASRGRVIVEGAVRSPGPQELPAGEPVTISTVIYRAGGFTPYANRKAVRLTRAAPTGKSERHIINFVDIIDKAQWEKDIEVLPKDTIRVPEKFINILN
jgi:polysaccharide export outer membrane protein